MLAPLCDNTGIIPKFDWLKQFGFNHGNVESFGFDRLRSTYGEAGSAILGIKDKKEQTCFCTLLFAQATGRHSDAPPWYTPLVVASYIGILKL